MPEPVVQVRNLKRHYEMKGETVHALDGLDLDVEAGEFLVIAGPSGSGKSTLLNILGGLDRPSEGSVKIEGKDLASMNPRMLAEMRRDRIGFIFQAYNLIPVLTVLENVEYVLQLQGVQHAERLQRCQELLSELGLEGMENRFPTELSGGQQQRVAVVRAMASDPAIILADEPTANLDTKAGNKLLDMMQELNEKRGSTFIFSTHDPKIMRRASRLVRIKDGKIDLNSNGIEDE